MRILTRRQRVRRIGGRFFIAAILLFGVMFLFGGLTGVDLGVHGGGHPWGCLTMLVCAVLVAISIVCWVVSLLL